MNDLGFSSVNNLIACYKRDSGNDKTEGALIRAYHRGDERLKGKLFAFAVKKNEKQIARKIKEVTSTADEATSNSLFSKTIVPLLLILFVVVVIAEMIKSHNRPISQKINDLLKEKGYSKKGFAECLYEDMNEENSEGIYHVNLDPDERKEDLRKFTAVVYKNLNDSNRNQETLQSYLEFAEHLPDMD